MYSGITYCQACLSTGRILHPIVNLFSLFQDTSLWELSSSPGGICWECHRVIVNFAKLKARIRTAQDLLRNTDKFKQVTSLSKLETCIFPTDKTINLIYDNENKHKEGDHSLNEEEFRPTLKKNEETKNEEKSFKLHKQNTKVEIEIKQEPNIEFNEKGSVFEPKSPEEQLFKEIQAFEVNTVSEDIYVDLLSFKDETPVRRPSKKVKKKFKKVRKRKNEPEEEIRQKFTAVEFSEEEMVRNREEKRSQPNFKKIPFKCDLCVLGFTRRDTYEAHLDKKHDEKNGPHICSVCQSRFQTQKLADRHKRKHYVLYRCKLCKYDTLELWSALSHCRSRHYADQVERIHCRYCVFVGKTPEELSQHMTSEHSVFCKECGEKFKKICNLKAHMRRIHAVKREFICDMCSKTFKSKSRLESHVASHSAALAQKLAYCALCKIQYKNIYVYRSHLRTSANHAEEMFQCVECNKRFASKVYWKKHYNFYHLHKSQFRCEVCNKLFISEWRLKNHRQTQHGHDRSRDHRCSDCGKLFFTSSTLKGHQLTHSTLRTFMCEDCGDTFKQRPALYTHCRLVHRGLKRRGAKPINK